TAVAVASLGGRFARCGPVLGRLELLRALGIALLPHCLLAGPLRHRLWISSRHAPPCRRRIESGGRRVNPAAAVLRLGGRERDALRLGALRALGGLELDLRVLVE